MNPPRKNPSGEFLVVALPARLEAGSMLQVIGLAPTIEEATQQVESLDATVLGRVAILEKRKLFIREQSIVSIETDDPIVL